MSIELKIQVAPPKVRMFYFVVAIIAIVAYRSIIILNNFSGWWVSLAWYIGTIGFAIYYIHRYQISKKRLEIIKAYKLDDKVKLLDDLGAEDKEALHYLLESLESSKERWNYFFTYVLTILSLIAGIILDIINFIK